MAERARDPGPDDATRETVSRRAAAHDLSLGEYLRNELAQLANAPTMAEWLAESDRWRAEHGGVSREELDQAVAEARAERDAREDDRLRH
ncbi:hypothetical protein BJF78_16025 [Pseudonocardia sp. CNS-139]|nr:hypothetical protein BJF78_16025 [Pseudonocardia sp. CNS-139]